MISRGAEENPLPLFERNFMELKDFTQLVERAEKECDVYCPICHKLLHVKAGDVIPRCCGKVMDVLE